MNKNVDTLVIYTLLMHRFRVLALTHRHVGVIVPSVALWMFEIERLLDHNQQSYLCRT